MDTSDVKPGMLFMCNNKFAPRSYGIYLHSYKNFNRLAFVKLGDCFLIIAIIQDESNEALDRAMLMINGKVGEMFLAHVADDNFFTLASPPNALSERENENR